MKSKNIAQVFCFRIVLALFIFGCAAPTYAQLSTISTTITGGIASIEDAITPHISFADGTTLFTGVTINQESEGMVYTISSDAEDENFSQFVHLLTNPKDDILKVGHEIGFVTGDLGSHESTWFGTLHENKNITRIELTYENIKFEVNTFHKWTNFSYDVTIHIYDDESYNVSYIDRNVDTDAIYNNNNQLKNGEEMEMTIAPPTDRMTIKGFDNSLDQNKNSHNMVSEEHVMSLSYGSVATMPVDKKIKTPKEDYSKMIGEHLLNQIKSIFE